jgi:2-keto-4-pentenoate hydratase/2-oxohepta-3-ene-1,7-dioic acid hydratase in catechol pathway
VRICRFTHGDEVGFGVLDNLDEQGEIADNSIIAILRGHPFGELDPDGRVIAASAVKLLAPILPNKIIGIGTNYVDHAVEMNSELPPAPLMFLKPSTSVIGPNESIILPKQASVVHHEAELAVVIGRFCKDVPRERAAEVILGYTCANDVSARDVQKSDGQWTRAKGFDTFCPLGPWIETDLDPRDLAIVAYVGDQQRQSGNTRDLIFSVADLVSYVSHQMTLLPGDVILTGTPAGVGPLVAGDEVEIAIEGIGSLVNKVECAQ